MRPLSNKIIWGILGGLLVIAVVNRQPADRPAVLSANATKIQVGQSLALPVNINTNSHDINAVFVELKFDPLALRVDSVKKDGSFITLWIEGEPTFSNEHGLISWSGGLPSPGFNGLGQVGTVYLTALRPGPTILTFTDQSQLLANDGLGTAVPIQTRSIRVMIRP